MLYIARFGCLTIHSLASKGDLLVIGGRINATQIANLQGKFVNAYQTTSGGGLDGFIAIVRYDTTCMFCVSE